jgi:hypothetical protein
LMQEISNSEFRDLIYDDVKDLISLTLAFKDMSAEEVNRPFLGRLNMEAGKCEEIIDAYGIKKNTYWYKLRKSTAVLKSLTQVAYNLLHLKYAAPFYKLLDIDGDFFQSTDHIIKQLLDSFHPQIVSFCEYLEKVEMIRDLTPIEEYGFRESVVTSHLACDQIQSASSREEEIACYIATHFLNLAEDTATIKIYKKTDPQDYIKCIPEIINEENIRVMANSFHNLQAKYDTYLFNTAIVQRDGNLPKLRGQISVVYHLLDTMTILIHYCERHMVHDLEQLSDNENDHNSIKYQDLLNIIFQYGILYSDRYIVAAQQLCKDILKSYSEQGEIEVAIPNYRGFHVRPSTLIAKIVVHYGSEVSMILGKNTYNAALPLELFRANEEINLSKRCMIAEHILEHKLVKNDADALYDAILMKKILRVIFLDLLEKQKIILYENDFSFDNLTPYENETLADFAKRGIALYQALGKIDIITDTTVIFKGDKRVLADLEVLAKNGYGEDKFGNNIVLPRELSYLRR